MSGSESLLSADQALTHRLGPDTGSSLGAEIPAELSECAHLTIEHAETGRTDTAFIAKDRLTLGRAMHNDLVLDHRSISAEHAVIVRDSDHYSIMDLGSRNGTAVNGNAVERMAINDTDQIELGVYRLMCHLPGKGVLNLPSRRAPVVLEFLTGGMRGINQRFVESANELNLGSDSVLLSRRENGWCITRLAGNSEFIVDGRRISDDAASLRHASEISIGKTRMRFLHL